VAGSSGVTSVFSDTGAEQCYTVPAGTQDVQIQATGAPGSPGCRLVSGDDCTAQGAPGGDGAVVWSTVPIPSGTTTLYVEVGGYDWGGGGAGTYETNEGAGGGGPGGGASDVQTCSHSSGSCTYTDANLLVVAAGGGGGGANNSAPPAGAGGNGGVDGSSGSNGTGCSTDTGGGGGTQTGGGAGGACSSYGTPAGSGTAGAGGAGLQVPSNTGGGGGGGGGGYYGGGGGAGASGGIGGVSAGGGGGSSYAPQPGAMFGVDTLQTSGISTGSVAITPYAVSSQGAAGSNGSAGPQGAAGVQGAAGPQGPAGANGKVELVTCVTVKKKKKCTTKVISSAVTFTASAARASLYRAGHVYAKGSLRDDKLTLHASKPLRTGHYTLKLTTGKHTTEESITVAQTITID
jgi:hypothetical protein